MLKKLPNYNGDLPESSTFALRSAEPYEVVLLPFLSGLTYEVRRQLIRTGLEPALKDHEGLLIVGSPGLWHAEGIVMMSPLLLTSESYGEIKVILCNLSCKPFVVRRGDQVAKATLVDLKGGKK